MMNSKLRYLVTCSLQEYRRKPPRGKWFFSKNIVKIFGPCLSPQSAMDAANKEINSTDPFIEYRLTGTDLTVFIKE